MLCYRTVLKTLFAGLLLTFCETVSFAQSCPPNIDFENGTFNGWTCWTGGVSAATGSNVIALSPSGPVQGRHTMLSAFPGSGLDEYGGFPTNCPNGSGFSVKLGNNIGGAEAEGMSYEFTIPAGMNVYSLIYHYAVVFEDPNHLDYQQPRMQIEITNVTDNTLINCSSFTFYPYGSPLPGFQQSTVGGLATPVWYKTWSAVSINLDGNAGKTIRLFFKTADCTFRRHFGYAYLDVNTECSGTFPGAAYCPDDTTVTVTAPYGYQNYTWFDQNFTQVLGHQQTLVLNPPPANGTTLAVEVVPYNGYGCLDTLYADLRDTLNYFANAGPNVSSCNHTPVQLGIPPKTGFSYVWTPPNDLTSASISNPYASPPATTSYVLHAMNQGGGCRSTDTVIVKAAVLDTTLQFFGQPVFCTSTGDSAVLMVNVADSIQWYKDNIPIAGANQRRYQATSSGQYFARLFSFIGCDLTTRSITVDIASVPVPVFSVNNPEQCLLNNRFVFANSSTNVLGGIHYHWYFGDGTESTTKDPIHIYKKAGIYNVKLRVNSNSICADSMERQVIVHQNAIAAFIAAPVCINLPMQVVNNTQDTVGSPISYLWNFGNGQTSTLRNPPVQLYPVEGSYTISLSVSTVQCPSPANTLRKVLFVDKPRPGISYPLEYAVENLPLDLQARSFGGSVLWTPATNLNDATSYKPVFIGKTDQLYNIAVKTPSGCITIDTQLVKVVKNVEIFVPNAFTPNRDGLNDYLRPLTMGIKQVVSFKVFNRWGQLWFQMNGTKPGWDGTYRGIPQESQTVVWTIEAIGADNKTYSRKGTSILLR